METRKWVVGTSEDWLRGGTRVVTYVLSSDASRPQETRVVQWYAHAEKRSFVRGSVRRMQGRSQLDVTTIDDDDNVDNDL